MQVKRIEFDGPNGLHNGLVMYRANGGWIFEAGPMMRKMVATHNGRLHLSRAGCAEAALFEEIEEAVAWAKRAGLIEYADKGVEVAEKQRLAV